MANIKQQIKRIKTSEKSRLRNAAFKSSLKTAIKNVELAVSENDHATADTANSIASKKLDKAVSKGLAHKNYVARQKSRLAKLVNSVK
ncbi:30S ribosomal protein S20 [Mycoplasmatota bacterium WC44]